ncbi:MAG TPA: hypothetical protein VFB66_09210 [Tepidisphaeraceae bacterium]|nr:hypothetical protein [Tepidisphaeraceae bacterium]
MLASLRQLYWRLKYRPGRRVTFCFGYDGFTEILVVENRVATTGTLVYRERDVNVWSEEQVPVRPPPRGPGPRHRPALTTYPRNCPACGRDLRSWLRGCTECDAAVARLR